MASTITIGGVEIRPTPLITVSQEAEYLDNGKLKKTVKVIEIKGKILSYDPIAGDDPITDEKERFAIIQSKWNTIQSAVEQNIGDLFLDSPPSAPLLETPCKLRSKNFQIEAANIFADYTLSFEKTIVQNDYIDDRWSLDPSDEYNRFIKISRTRSIQFQDDEDQEGYLKAIEKIPVTSSIADATAYLPATIVAISDSNAYNKTVSYSVGKVRGTVECSESWTLCKDSAYVEATITLRESSDSIYPTVNYQGTIYGLESAGKTKYQNALAKKDEIIEWTMDSGYSIAGYEDVGSKIISMSEGSNPAAGTINFSVEVTEGLELPGERYRSVNVTDNRPSPLYANIQAIGKTDGPILQRLGTFKAGNKSVTIDVVYNDGSTTLPDTSEYQPVGASEFFIEKDEHTIDVKTGRVSRTTSWIYST